MNRELLRYCGLQAITGAFAGAIGTIVSEMMGEDRIIQLILIYMAVYFLLALLVGAFRKFIFRKSFFVVLPKG